MKVKLVWMDVFLLVKHTNFTNKNESIQSIKYKNLTPFKI